MKGLEGETDDSGFEFCSTPELRPNDADVFAFGSIRFEIPAKATHDITSTLTVPASFGEIHAIGAFPHMHQTGKSISTKLHPAAGGEIDLGTDEAFDFGNQFFAPLPDVVIKPGDVVKTRCVWENPTDKPIPFGENTSHEMCFSFTMYYPKVTTGSWAWVLPAFSAKTTVN